MQFNSSHQRLAAGDYNRAMLRGFTALAAVLVYGTFGYMIVEDWGFWKSLYFTIITISTVGYGDYGLDRYGEQFTICLLVVGIGAATYAFGQLAQAAVSYQLDWRRKMQKTINRLRDHYIVCGFGRVGQATGRQLDEANIPYIVIDKNEEHCHYLRDRGHAVVCGSATDNDILHEAGIDRAKGLVCAAGNDAENIVITLSARQIRDDLTIVSRAEADDAVRKIKLAGASRVVSPSLNGGNDIANVLTKPYVSEFIAASQGGEDGYHLTEIRILPGSKIIGRTIRDFGEAEPAIVFVAVVHASGEKRIRPGSDVPFAENDVLIVVGDHESLARMRLVAAGGEPIARAG